MDNERYYQLGRYDSLFNQIDELTDALAIRDAEIVELRKQVSTQSVDIERLLTAIARCKEVITNQDMTIAATKHNDRS